MEDLQRRCRNRRSDWRVQLALCLGNGSFQLTHSIVFDVPFLLHTQHRLGVTPLGFALDGPLPELSLFLSCFETLICEVCSGTAFLLNAGDVGLGAGLKVRSKFSGFEAHMGSFCARD